MPAKQLTMQVADGAFRSHSKTTYGKCVQSEPIIRTNFSEIPKAHNSVRSAEFITTGKAMRRPLLIVSPVYGPHRRKT